MCCPKLLWGARLIEIAEAVGEPAEGRAPGPDGFPAELFRKLPILQDALTILFNIILETGDIPTALRRIYLVPILKPSKDPQLCASRRPISLLSAIIKLLETVLYGSMLGQVEPLLAPQQYAYRRERGAEMALIEVYDAAHRALNRARHVHIMSFDVSGAFDNVSH